MRSPSMSGSCIFMAGGSVRLDLDRLRQLADMPVPLVLHGASSVDPDDLRAAIALGVRKINVGSRLKQAFLDAMRDAAMRSDRVNPYEAIGSGLANDVMVAGRLAMQAEVQRLMRLFGSAGKADSVKHPIVVPHLGATGGDVKIVAWQVAEGSRRRGRRDPPHRRDRQVDRRGRGVSRRASSPHRRAGRQRKGAGRSDRVADGRGRRTGRRRFAAAKPCEATRRTPRVASAGSQREAAARYRSSRLSSAPDAPDRRPAAERLTDAFATMVLIRRYEEHLYQLFLQGHRARHAASMPGAGSGRGRRLLGAPARRPDLQHAPAGRTSDRQGRFAERDHRRDLGKGDRLRRRQGRPDASCRFLRRRHGLQRHRRRQHSDRDGKRHGVPSPRARPRRGELLRRRRLEYRRLPRGPEPRGGAEGAGGLRLREQSLRRLDAHFPHDAHPRHIAPRRRPTACRASPSTGWMSRRSSGPRRPRWRGPAPARGRRSSSARPTATAATRAAIPGGYRDKSRARRMERQGPDRAIAGAAGERARRAPRTACRRSRPKPRPRSRRRWPSRCASPEPDAASARQHVFVEDA